MGINWEVVGLFTLGWLLGAYSGYGRGLARGMVEHMRIVNKGAPAGKGPDLDLDMIRTLTSAQQNRQ